MAHRGTATSPDDDDDQTRRDYRLTNLGRKVCIAEADRLAELVRLTRRI